MAYHVIGAFDRFNYGDILFSRIVDDLLSRKSENNSRFYYSVSNSDMRSFGGVVTVGMNSFNRRSVSSDDFVYIAGGDVLTTDWPVIIGHSSGYLKYNLLRVVRKVFGSTRAGNIAGKLYGSEFEFPFVFSPDDFDTPPRVIYNAVGGSGFINIPDHPILPRIVEKLSAATRISVRDAQSHAFLQERGVAVELRPDSAACMSLLYDREFLGQHRPTLLSGLSRYVVVQCALHVGKVEIENVVRRAIILSEELDAHIVLLPIGTAPAHDDDKFLKVIEARFSDAKVKALLLPQMHIFEIMATIAGAAAYAGSSLHGAITSLSYGVPAAPLVPNKVSKLTAYLNTWAVPSRQIGDLIFYAAREPDGAAAARPC